MRRLSDQISSGTTSGATTSDVHIFVDENGNVTQIKKSEKPRLKYYIDPDIPFIGTEEGCVIGVNDEEWGPCSFGIAMGAGDYLMVYASYTPYSWLITTTTTTQRLTTTTTTFLISTTTTTVPVTTTTTTTRSVTTTTTTRPVTTTTTTRPVTTTTTTTRSITTTTTTTISLVTTTTTTTAIELTSTTTTTEPITTTTTTTAPVDIYYGVSSNTRIDEDIVKNTFFIELGFIGSPSGRLYTFPEGYYYKYWCIPDVPNSGERVVNYITDGVINTIMAYDSYYNWYQLDPTPTQSITYGKLDINGVVYRIYRTISKTSSYLDQYVYSF